ncbi:MAG: 4Fe-4S dicluster domain-containing protein [Alphaproteobacteria bacterium]
MLPNNNAARIRKEILIKLSKAFLEDDLEHNLDRIPLEMRPKDSANLRCCIYKDRAIIKYACMASMGFAIEDEKDELKPLSEYAKEALLRSQNAKEILTVIDAACQGCIKAQYMVTNACQGCLARPCTLNCPKEAITIKKGKAEINPDLCVNCGRCFEACPYHSIIRIPVPCEEACPVGAITKDENGKEHIDQEKCISCGKCLLACPFGAIMERSHIVDVLRKIKNKKNIVAMIAPAIVGQFPGTLEQLAGALLKAGFSDVIEVATGADITTENEAKEFLHKMSEGQSFMTTSCCPAYVEAVKKHIPELSKYVSTTLSPMRYTAEIVKKEKPDCVAVFIGPCVAKRTEAYSDENVDHVLTFEELGAIFVASNIDVTACEPVTISKYASGNARNFPISGGVAAAVQAIAGENANIIPEKIDGLDKEAIKLLKRFACKGCSGNLVEVMACNGGCIAGPSALANPKFATRAVTKLVGETKEKI